MKVYQRGSVEFHETPLLNGDDPIAPTSVCATPHHTYPTDEWATPATLEDKVGLMVGDYDSGLWWTWTRVASAPETPIVRSESFYIS